MATTPEIDKDYKKGGSEVRSEATEGGGQVGREKGGLRSEYKGRRVHGENSVQLRRSPSEQLQPLVVKPPTAEIERTIRTEHSGHCKDISERVNRDNHWQSRASTKDNSL